MRRARELESKQVLPSWLLSHGHAVGCGRVPFGLMAGWCGRRSDAARQSVPKLARSSGRLRVGCIGSQWLPHEVLSDNERGGVSQRSHRFWKDLWRHYSTAVGPAEGLLLEHGRRRLHRIHQPGCSRLRIPGQAAAVLRCAPCRTDTSRATRACWLFNGVLRNLSATLDLYHVP